MKPPRILAPTFEERRLWAAFVEAATRHGDALLLYRANGGAGSAPHAEQLLRARRRCRKRRMPESQQSRASALYALLALVDQWAGLDVAGRLDRAAELSRLAASIAGDIEPKRRARKDIDE